ncbi:hypothetical protein NNJEOMEG_00546 [Fundidesulfovibrio magnetotacticus]|uniref:YlxP-like protein n=1 Tax=Fundidesulfovibrio magnetotacticus TaxID=2730080 RepID=A0A6V8LRG6_9BACT|nr:DUF503 domain-containing protein [Fundidesulfovibrio magnetotacticus]GFK92719.1 hypothetical protein NNJEOMEG_00546 [Fundidesulfovibrio magnetotacticus]
MIVGVLTLEFRLHGNDSLKGKRSVAQRLKMKLRNKFNVAVSEIAHQDMLDTLALGVVTVSPDAKHAQGLLQKALNMVVAADEAELIYDDIELIGP